MQIIYTEIVEVQVSHTQKFRKCKLISDARFSENLTFSDSVIFAATFLKSNQRAKHAQKQKVYELH